MAGVNFAVTVTLLQQERELREAFANEHEPDGLEEAFRVLLRDFERREAHNGR
jgi:hypothetical protein